MHFRSRAHPVSNIPPTDPAVTNALLDLVRVARLTNAPWSLIGGEALLAYGVPKNTEDVDALVEQEDLLKFAETLVETFSYVPLIYDTEREEYVPAERVTVHTMDDPVLHVERELVPLRSPLGLDVELLAAQHPVEQEMIDQSMPLRHYGVSVPVAPLGGVLLVKTIADRPKDVAAIEQTAESLPKEQIDGALAWATEQDPAGADDLRALVSAARTRRAPKRTKPYIRNR